MTKPRHHDHDFHLFALIVESVGHAKRFGDVVKILCKRHIIKPVLGDEADAHEKLSGFHVVKLRTVSDVTPHIGQKRGNGRDNAA